MLERLAESAAAEDLVVDTVVGPADAGPDGRFDAVMERHLLWTLPDPVATLRTWRGAAGRVVLIESVWGDTGTAERLRSLVRRGLRRLRATPPDHHGEYPDALRASLPFGSGTPPAEVRRAVEAAGWAHAQVRRLEELQRAERRALPFPERLVGVTPRFAVTAEATRAG